MATTGDFIWTTSACRSGSDVLAEVRREASGARGTGELVLDSGTTLTVFALGAMLTLVAAWGDHRRRRQLDTRLALLPWHGLLFLGVAVMLFMAAHGLTLLKA